MLPRFARPRYPGCPPHRTVLPRSRPLWKILKRRRRISCSTLARSRHQIQTKTIFHPLRVSIYFSTSVLLSRSEEHTTVLRTSIEQSACLAKHIVRRGRSGYRKTRSGWHDTSEPIRNVKTETKRIHLQDVVLT